MNLLFDLDGTLTDPRQGILACFKYALDELKVGCPTDHELETFIGPPLHESFAGLLGADDPAMVRDAIALYRGRFASKGTFENDIYPGIVEALAQLRAEGAWLSVATVKPRVFAERIVKHFGLDRFLHAVYGSESDGSNADKGNLLAHLLEAESLSSVHTVMIGDRALDVLAAKENGIFSVGVLWGFGSREELASAGAEVLCAEPKLIVDVVSAINVYRDNARKGGALVK